MTTAAIASDTSVTLPADSNQALGIGRFAVDFMSGKIGEPDASVLKRVELFHTDATLCGLSALALGVNAPRILRDEALDYAVASGKPGATVFGSGTLVAPEKAIEHPSLIKTIKMGIDELNQDLNEHERIRKWTLLPREFSLEENEITPTLKVRRRVIIERYHDLISSMYLKTQQVSA